MSCKSTSGKLLESCDKGVSHEDLDGAHYQNHTLFFTGGTPPACLDASCVPQNNCITFPFPPFTSNWSHVVLAIEQPSCSRCRETERRTPEACTRPLRRAVDSGLAVLHEPKGRLLVPATVAPWAI